MYVRLFRDKHGKIFVQQLLTLQEPAKNGVPQPEVVKWENVPTMGDGQTEAYNLPISSSCGVLLFEHKETIFYSVSEGHREVQSTYAVSALDIYKVTPRDNSVMIFTKDKLNFSVNMPYHEFMELLISLLNNYKLLRFNIEGKLIKEN